MSADPPEIDEKTRPTYRHGDLRCALIEAGLALARANGPEAIVLREATRRAGVVPNAAYRHFANRDELLDAVRSAALAAVAAAMERAVSDELASLAALSAKPSLGDQGRARLRAIGLGYLRFAREETGLFLTAFGGSRLVSERDARPERAGPGGLNPFELLSASLDDMVEGGVLAPEHRPNAEYLAWSSVHGLAMLTIDGPLARLAPTEFDALGAALVEMVERGLR